MLRRPLTAGHLRPASRLATYVSFAVLGSLPALDFPSALRRGANNRPKGRSALRPARRSIQPERGGAAGPGPRGSLPRLHGPPTSSGVKNHLFFFSERKRWFVLNQKAAFRQRIATFFLIQRKKVVSFERENSFPAENHHLFSCIEQNRWFRLKKKSVPDKEKDHLFSSQREKGGF